MNHAEEVLGLARDLIRFDTSNAPNQTNGELTGHETAVAEHLAGFLSDVGVECELVARQSHQAFFPQGEHGAEGHLGCLQMHHLQSDAALGEGCRV